MSQDFNSDHVAALRRDYMQRGLDEAEVDPSPFRQFSIWFEDALASKAIHEPNAMVLSTVSAEGQPRGRFVLLKGISEAGFVFFTNYQSAKGRDLAANSRASLTFGWIELERQICIEGLVTKTPRSAVEDYFRTRPRGSKLGAWASPQSEVIVDRGILLSRLETAEKKFSGDVPPPPEWGGYLLTPGKVEFWQGRTNRLHDRLRYYRAGTDWKIERIAP